MADSVLEGRRAVMFVCGDDEAGKFSSWWGLKRSMLANSLVPGSWNPPCFLSSTPPTVRDATSLCHSKAKLGEAPVETCMGQYPTNARRSLRPQRIASFTICKVGIWSAPEKETKLKRRLSVLQQASRGAGVRLLLSAYVPTAGSRRCVSHAWQWHGSELTGGDVKLVSRVLLISTDSGIVASLLLR